LIGINHSDKNEIYEAEVLENEDDFIIGIQYLQDIDSVCVALRGGDILLYNKISHSVFFFF